MVICGHVSLFFAPFLSPPYIPGIFKPNDIVEPDLLFADFNITTSHMTLNANQSVLSRNIFSSPDYERSCHKCETVFSYLPCAFALQIKLS